MTTQDTSTRRRVKLYALNADRQWDDRGTGHVTSGYVERLKGENVPISGRFCLGIFWGGILYQLFWEGDYLFMILAICRRC